MPSTQESVEHRKRRARKILRVLEKGYPVAECALLYKNAFELLIATILSAQSTDETVNRVTPALFKRYPTPAKLARAKRETIEGLVHASGFYRQKAKNIQGAAKIISDEHQGEVPDEMDDLLRLPGVARKTANVVLGTWFGKNVGVVVDTHVGRLAQRLCLTWKSKDSKDAKKIELDLMELIPRNKWTYLSHALIWHGRGVCPARKPRCGVCDLRKYCPSAETLAAD